MRKVLSTMLLCFGALLSSYGDGINKHVVLVVWDGMRPDFINGTNTPTLYDLAHRGVFFAHNRSVYVSSTEVNGTALATGAYPEHSGVIGNREFRPKIDPSVPIDTQSLDAMRKGDEQGGYLAVSTLALTLQRAGYRTAIAGTKPVVLLQDHSEGPANTANVVLYEGHTLPEGLITNFIHLLGPFADKGATKTNRDIWTTRSLAELIWKKEVPQFSLLWLAEPDNTQHATGVGSTESIAAIHNSDYALSRVVAELKARGVFDLTDIIVVSDHGFSNISRKVDLAGLLSKAGFKAVREFTSTPTRGDVLVVGLGGSAFIYVIDHDEKTIAGVVKYLQTQDFAGPIFTARACEGTLPLDDAMIHSAHAPDIALSFGWSSDAIANGVPGTVISESQGSNLDMGSGQKATHASLSRFDLHNTLVAAGPDFRQGFVDNIPTGNVDVAPTILKILGVKPAQHVDGRVLSEALNLSNTGSANIQSKELRAQAKLPGGEWEESLRVTEVDGVRYLEQGTGSYKAVVNQ